MAFEKISFPDLLKEWKNLPALKKRRIQQLWVKKEVTITAWNNYYSQSSSYCDLGIQGEGKNKKKVVGFLIVNPELPNGKLLYPAGVFPKDCLPITDYEALQIDEYRRAVNVFPVPCETLKIEKYEKKI